MKNVVIIGGGIVGLTCAYYLSLEKNLSITVIDKDFGQATKNSAGIICPWLSLRRNKDWLKLVNNGAYFYPQFIADLQKNNISQQFYYRNGTFVFKKSYPVIEKVLKQVEKNLTLNVYPGKIRVIDNAGLQQLFPHFANEHHALFAYQGARVDGALLVKLLRETLIRNGVTIIEKSAIVKDKQIFIENQPLAYDELVLACGAWLDKTLKDYNVDIYPQKGQLIKLLTDNDTTDIPSFMLDGELDIVPQLDGKIIIGATHENNMNFDLSLDYGKLLQMKQTAAQYFPFIRDIRVQDFAVGTRAYTSDFTPFFGKYDFFYTASGLGSSGLTSGPYIAHHIAMRILNKIEDENIESFSPYKYIHKID